MADGAEELVGQSPDLAAEAIPAGAGGDPSRRPRALPKSSKDPSLSAPNDEEAISYPYVSYKWPMSSSDVVAALVPPLLFSSTCCFAISLPLFSDCPVHSID